MIISHGRRYIFVHIPKTAGTAMALALEDRAMKDDVLIGDTPKAKRRKGRLKDVKARGRVWKHSTLQDVYGLVDQNQIEEYFVFTLVRNPWDRLVSYYHWLGAQNFLHPAVGLAKSMDFSGFLNHPQTVKTIESSPYGSYVTDKDGVQRCNLFIRIEDFEDDVRNLETHLGFQIGALPRANASERENSYSDYYSDNDRDIVGRICAHDIARFGYVFES